MAKALVQREKPARYTRRYFRLTNVMFNHLARRANSHCLLPGNLPYLLVWMPAWIRQSLLVFRKVMPMLYGMPEDAPAMMRSVPGVLSKLLGTEEWFVIHHTDCGMELFTDEIMHKLLSKSLKKLLLWMKRAGGTWKKTGARWKQNSQHS